METVTDVIFLGSTITVDSGCHWLLSVKRFLISRQKYKGSCTDRRRREDAHVPPRPLPHWGSGGQQGGSCGAKADLRKGLLCAHVCSHFSHVQLCDPMDCSPPGSPVHWIAQPRILKWVAMPSSRRIFPTEESNPCLLFLLLAGKFFTTSATWEARTCILQWNDGTLICYQLNVWYFPGSSSVQCRTTTFKVSSSIYLLETGTLSLTYYCWLGIQLCVWKLS